MENEKNEKNNKIEKDNTSKKENINDSTQNVNSNKKTDKNKGKDEKYSFYVAKRSYSCKINEPRRNKNFSNNDDIKLNLNKKFMIIKTPQIKPKKSELIPVPINLGSVSYSKAKSKFNLLNEQIGVINDIISEGDNEESNEFSYDSSSSIFTENEEENKEKEDNNSILSDNEGANTNNQNNNNNNNNDNGLLTKNYYSSHIGKSLKVDDKIDEENDDYDENGKISVRNLRRSMIQSRRIFLKNDRDYFDKIDNYSISQYQKLKEDILMNKENEEFEKSKNRTIGFGQTRRRHPPILDFLKKNSSTAVKLDNK